MEYDEEHLSRCWDWVMVKGGKTTATLRHSACDDCRAIESRENAAFKCPECKLGLIFRTRGMKTRASCCCMPWILHGDGRPCRVWGNLVYPDKRLENYDDWKPRSKREPKEDVAEAA